MGVIIDVRLYIPKKPTGTKNLVQERGALQYVNLFK